MSKGAAGASGATPSALYSYCCGRPGDPENPPDRFRDDVLRSGLTVSDPLLVDYLAQEGFARFEDLSAMGMPWTRSADGSFDLGRLPGHSAARAFHVGRSTGKVFSAVLLRASHQAGVSFAQYQVALDLLMHGNTVAGVVFLDLVSGEAFVRSCDAVIVATGGAAGLYRLHTNPPGATGDGLAMILRAGGELVDMEFMQMYPTVLVDPPSVFGMEIPTGQLLAAGGRLLNRQHEEFFGRWEKVPLGQATRDVLARTIAREIQAGGGTDAGGVYLDARHVTIDMERDRYIRFLQDLGVDPTRDLQQVAPGAHYSLGGIRVTPPASCRGLNGLFAAGEVVGGVHGGNRLAGDALTETQVFGAQAGRAAAEYIGDMQDRDEHLRAPVKGESPLYDGLCAARARGTGCTAGDIRDQLTKVMDQYATVVRTASGLDRALVEIDSLRRLFHTSLALPPRASSEIWHPELLQYVETANMLDAAQALLASALVRTESRGSHYRDDYPERDDSWDGRNLIVTKTRGQGPLESLAVVREDRASGERRQLWP